jgi:hypothetical protein
MKEEEMTKRPYAAGVAILATLLLTSAFGATIEWVDVDGSEKPAGTIPLPPGTEAPILSTSEACPPAPQPPNLYAMPLDYVYIDPVLYGANAYPWCVFADWPYGFRQQHLYLGSEIGRSGTIAQIALFKTCFSNTATFPNVSVKLCTTSVSSLTSTFSDNYGGNTPVWVYHNDALVRGGAANMWDTVDLTTPFEYNNSSNLLVEIVWVGQASGTGWPGSWFNFASVSGNRRAVAVYITDTLVPTAYYVDDYYYNTRIGFFKDGTPDPWTGDMLTQGYWKNHPYYDPKHPDAPYVEEFLPVTVAGEEVNTVEEALAVFNPPKPMTAWKMFLIQLLAAKLNAGWQTDPSLINAWYDFPGGDYPFDNQRVYGIFQTADDYTGDTDKATLNKMKTVLDDMNNYRDKDNGCLWNAMWSPGTGPQGEAAALTTEPRLSVVPSVVKSGIVRIAYALPRAAPAQLTVLDITGRTVTTQDLPAAVGTGVVSLDTRSLGAGVYVVKLATCGNVFQQKLAVTR